MGLTFWGFILKEYLCRFINSVLDYVSFNSIRCWSGGAGQTSRRKYKEHHSFIKLCTCFHVSFKSVGYHSSSGEQHHLVADTKNVCWATVIWPPWLHQLAVLSIGDELCFVIRLSPYVNHHSTTINLFCLLTFDLFVCGPIFLNPDLHTTLSPRYPTNLLTLLTFLLALPANEQPIPYLFFLSKTSISW